VRPSDRRERLAIVMVGLPARGKTFIARKLARYLAWLGHTTHVFNVGSYRRERLGSGQDAGFFDPANPEGIAARLAMATAALDDLIAWFDAGGEIGLYDATNSTRQRRRMVRDRLRERGIDVLFVESVCEDQSIVDQNVRETKLSSPDYTGVDADDAVRDFRARIAHYERAYEPMSAEDDASFIQLVDVGRRIVLERIQGYLPGRLVFFLMNLHVTRRPVWLCRHGESAFNRLGIVGGDPDLSENGTEYARRLSAWLADQHVTPAPIVWTSTLRRARETAGRVPTRAWRALDEIDAGVCDGMTYADIEAKMPEEAAARAGDKLRYRYPRGESYEDVIQRLEPVIIELERQRSPVLIIAHQAVIRALYAYLMDLAPADCPRLPVPLHTVIELTPNAYGCTERRMFLGPALGA
jgi:broad specificity phosphatase PhoE